MKFYNPVTNTCLQASLPMYCLIQVTTICTYLLNPLAPNVRSTCTTVRCSKYQHQVETRHFTFPFCSSHLNSSLLTSHQALNPGSKVLLQHSCSLNIERVSVNVINVESEAKCSAVIKCLVIHYSSSTNILRGLICPLMKGYF
jgi:hypothetical protein